MAKKFEDLTFADDWMFQAVLKDPLISAELVELLLGVRVGRVEYPELEKAIRPFYSTKGVRLDVYLFVNLDDKSLKVIYNASAYESEKDERIRALLRFVQTNESGGDDFSNRLDALVKKMKKSEKLRQEYMAMNLHDHDMIKRGREEKAVEDATILVRDFNADPKVAAEKMSAPLDKVLEALSAPAQA